MELTINEFYRWKDDPFVHQILGISNGSVLYRKYNPVDGKIIEKGICSYETFEKSIESILSKEEVSKMEVKKDTETEIMLAIQAQRDSEKKALKSFRTQFLVEELESRGYICTKKT